MKKIDIGQMITILANIGVIAGIVFLSVELRQNNETLKLEQRIGAKQSLDALRLEQRNNSELRTAILKDVAGQELTPEEVLLLSSYAGNTLDTVEWIWHLSPEARADLLFTNPGPISQLPPFIQRAWAMAKEDRDYDAAFVEFFEDAPATGAE